MDKRTLPEVDLSAATCQNTAETHESVIIT